jgi:hypothetical protein
VERRLTKVEAELANAGAVSLLEPKAMVRTTISIVVVALLCSLSIRSAGAENQRSNFIMRSRW